LKEKNTTLNPSSTDSKTRSSKSSNNAQEAGQHTTNNLGRSGRGCDIGAAGAANTSTVGDRGSLHRAGERLGLGGGARAVGRDADNGVAAAGQGVAHAAVGSRRRRRRGDAHGAGRGTGACGGRVGSTSG
jgi:hypothetical protein